MNYRFLVFIILFFMISCGSNSSTGIFTNPLFTGVDSTNDRLFVLEKKGVLLGLTASTRNKLGDQQPLVNLNNNTTIHDLLPLAPLGLAVTSLNSTTRLFITGLQTNAEDNQILNQILVLDFDGTSVTEAAISPLTLEDGDNDTDNSQDIPGDLLVDSASSRLYVINSTTGALHTFNLETGAIDQAPIDIAGTPARMSLDQGFLFITNSSATVEQQVITVIDTSDFSTNTIDLNIPLLHIAVLSNDSGTALLTQQYGAQRVHLLSVNMDDFSTQEIPSATEEINDGVLSAGAGITSVVGDLTLTQQSNGTLYGYVAQSDGTITLLTIQSDFSAFTTTQLFSVTNILEGFDILTDSNGNGTIVYLAASGSGDLVYTEVGSSEVDARF